MHIDELTHIIIGSAIKIHRALGPGLYESVYQAALAYELQKAKIPFEKEKILAVHYQDVILDIGFRCDFLIDNRIKVCKLTKIRKVSTIMIFLTIFLCVLRVLGGKVRIILMSHFLLPYCT